MRHLFTLGIVIGGLGWFGAEAVAQEKKKIAAPGDLPIAQLHGKVVALKPQGKAVVVEMENDDKKTYYIKCEPGTTRVKVIGAALAEFLKPGLHVRFEAFLVRNSVKDPVAKLQVFRPEDGYQIGVFRDNPEDKKSSSLIAGQIKSVKNGKVMVAAGNQQIRIELAEAVEIAVDSGDIRLARPGDTIKVLGRIVQEPDQILGNEVDVTLGEPLAGAEETAKKPRAGSRTARNRKPAEKDASLAEDAGADKDASGDGEQP